GATKTKKRKARGLDQGWVVGTGSDRQVVSGFRV
ncbi:MAG: hypothetical protein ACI8P9_003529, partial [Parasphingorhabdus sp.]